MLNEEKRLIEKSSEVVQTDLSSKVQTFDKDLTDLKEMNMFLVEVIDEREKMVNEEVERMRQEMSSL
jgi:hypothetical protein